MTSHINYPHATKGLDRHRYYMGIAEAVSRRSSCCRRQVGAVLVKDDRIISTGYNGTPRGFTNCNEGGCKRCYDSNTESGGRLEDCICCHAEENSIVQAAFHGISTKGALLYTTLYPCRLCAKLIINGGVREVIYHEEYHDGNILLVASGIPTIMV